ncbi:hypothetical protein YC2023_055987 [Brassica napus]
MIWAMSCLDNMDGLHDSYLRSDAKKLIKATTNYLQKWLSLQKANDKEAEMLRLGYVKPEVVSWSPRIIVLHNFLSSEHVIIFLEEHIQSMLGLIWNIFHHAHSNKILKGKLTFKLSESNETLRKKISGNLIADHE